jgi:hypothetical protein
MKWIDVFNGDADGLCALHQLRLVEPAEAELVTGPKRDTVLLARVTAGHGDLVTVLDISLDRNRDALVRLLDRGARVCWFDHHYAGDISAHPLLEAHIDSAPAVCTSMIVDRHLGGRHRAWAVVAAFGDGLPDSASALASSIGLSEAQQATLRSLGEDLNYNAYGETERELLAPPAELYRRLHRYADPFTFAEQEPVIAELSKRRGADLAAAAAIAPYRAGVRGDVYVLPDAAWSRRVMGTFANHLARREPERAHAVLAPAAGSGYGVSIRSPRSAPTGAVRLARAFPTGGGREAAAGIDRLPSSELEAFIAAFEQAFRVPRTRCIDRRK